MHKVVGLLHGRSLYNVIRWRENRFLQRRHGYQVAPRQVCVRDRHEATVSTRLWSYAQKDVCKRKVTVYRSLRKVIRWFQEISVQGQHMTQSQNSIQDYQMTPRHMSVTGHHMTPRQISMQRHRMTSWHICAKDQHKTQRQISVQGHQLTSLNKNIRWRKEISL